MKAMVLQRPAPAESSPLRCVDLPQPQPGRGRALLRVLACGVCRSDLHLVEGELSAHRLPVVPGHQIVARVEAVGADCGGLQIGDVVGAGWVHAACGDCRFCRSCRENLCDDPVFMGYDVDGGFAQFCKARADFLYPLPPGVEPGATAPLMCAGVIGLRALRQSAVAPKGKLALYGFGGSAHVAIQIARHWGCAVHVFTRSPSHQRLAMELGAASAGAQPSSQERFDAAVLFAPAGELVPVALEALEKGGTLAVAGIHLSAIPALAYQKHLFHERRLMSVTAHTRADGRELLELAREIPILTRVKRYPLERANEALQDLKQGKIEGSAVLMAG